MIENLIPELFDLSPRGIREHLKLSNPIYEPTAAYGHFGRIPSDKGHFTWEKTNLVDNFRRGKIDFELKELIKNADVIVQNFRPGNAPKSPR